MERENSENAITEGILLKVVDRLRTYGIHFYFIVFFSILVFRYQKIDIIRVPSFAFLAWQMWKKRLPLNFFIDPISTSIFLLIFIASTSNALNGIPQDKIIRLVNWFFPYYLGKYVIIKCPEIKIDDILRYLLICATLFSMVGLLGYLFGWETLFGQRLFEAERYKFTFRKINFAGFYMGSTLVLCLYFFIRQKVSWGIGNLLLLFCWAVVFSSLFLIQERKTIVILAIIIMLLLLVYSHYKLLMLAVIASGIILTTVPVPQRYQFLEWFDDGAVQQRLNAWEAAVGLFKEKPFIGHGYTSFRQACEEYNQKYHDKMRFKEFGQFKFAHNINLNALAELGVLGFMVINFIFFYCWRFYRYRHTARQVFSLGLTIAFFYGTMQFGGFTHSPARADLIFLIIGLYYALQQAHEGWTAKHAESR